MHSLTARGKAYDAQLHMTDVEFDANIELILIEVSWADITVIYIRRWIL